MGAEDDAERRQRRWWTRTVDWSLRRQEPRRSVWPWLARGQWTSLASPTVCRPCCSSCCCLARCFVLSQFSSLLVAVLFQFGCCWSVALLFVLLFSIVLCFRFILRCCAHGISLRAPALVFRLALCAWFVERRL